MKHKSVILNHCACVYVIKSEHGFISDIPPTHHLRCRPSYTDDLSKAKLWYDAAKATQSLEHLRDGDIFNDIPADYHLEHYTKTTIFEKTT